MLFSVNLFNHCKAGQRTLEDLYTAILLQLKALGHDVQRWDEGFVRPPGINLLFECFFEDLLAPIRECRAKGYRFGVIATEQPGESGFNHGKLAELVERQRVFPAVREFADFIWHLVAGEDVNAWYRQFAPACYLPLGYAPGLVCRPEPRADHDFGFYGAVEDGGRRDVILRRIAAKGYRVRLIKDFLMQEERDIEMARCRVILQIRPYHTSELVSTSRIVTVIQACARPIVSEPHKRMAPYDRIVTVAPTDGALLRTALSVHKTYRQSREEQLTRLRILLPPQTCVGRALRETGVIERLAA